MSSSLSELKNWPDRDFFSQGAFLAFDDRVILAKGGSFERVSEISVHDSPVFYLKDFYSNSYLSYTPQSFIEVSHKDILQWISEEDISHAKLIEKSNDDDLYEKDFRGLSSQWSVGLKKVVMVSRETYSGFRGEETVKMLFKKSFEFGTGTPYGIWHSEYGVIGSTPEILYSIDHEKFETFALAGTAKKGQEEELLRSSKDRHEHDLVIKDITEKIAEFVTDLYVHETDIHQYKTIVHLKTDIEAKIVNPDLTKLTNLLSPTAALGGYPKDMSLNFLMNTEYGKRYPERYFGSCFGIRSRNFSKFLVSIRNVQWSTDSLFIESGGGVVPESHFEKELEEIHLKRNTIKAHYL